MLPPADDVLLDSFQKSKDKLNQLQSVVTKDTDVLTKVTADIQKAQSDMVLWRDSVSSDLAYKENIHLLPKSLHSDTIEAQVVGTQYLDSLKNLENSSFNTRQLMIEMDSLENTDEIIQSQLRGLPQTTRGDMQDIQGTLGLYGQADLVNRELTKPLLGTPKVQMSDTVTKEGLQEIFGEVNLKADVPNVDEFLKELVIEPDTTYADVHRSFTEWVGKDTSTTIKWTDEVDNDVVMDLIKQVDSTPESFLPELIDTRRSYGNVPVTYEDIKNIYRDYLEYNGEALETSAKFDKSLDDLINKVDEPIVTVVDNAFDSFLARNVETNTIDTPKIRDVSPESYVPPSDIVLYHGTKTPSDIRTWDVEVGSGSHELGKGIYLTRNKEVAEAAASKFQYENVPININGTHVEPHVKVVSTVNATDILDLNRKATKAELRDALSGKMPDTDFLDFYSHFKKTTDQSWGQVLYSIRTWQAGNTGSVDELGVHHIQDAYLKWVSDRYDMGRYVGKSGDRKSVV
jgi:uncharacterized protein involved in tolerance to divalent cations